MKYLALAALAALMACAPLTPEQEAARNEALREIALERLKNEYLEEYLEAGETLDEFAGRIALKGSEVRAELQADENFKDACRLFPVFYPTVAVDISNFCEAVLNDDL